MTASTPRPFTFDTIFDGDRVISPPKPKRTFTPEEVEAARAEAFAEGQRSVVARAEAEAARALQEAAQAIRAGLGQLAEIAHAHRSDSAELALACGRRIADAALEHFPEQPALAALEALARELEGQPRLVVRASPAGVERLRPALEAAADSVGFAGLLVVKADPGLPSAAFSFDWGEGRALFDPTAAAARVASALQTALAAEAGHAEPLAPAPEVFP